MSTHTGRVDLDPVFLLYAFRYALGRRSYAVADVAETLIAHRSALTEDWRQQIVQDIDNAIAHDMAGMDCDVDTWRRVAEAMR